MPARATRRHNSPEMPASLLIDLHRDPDHYAEMVEGLSQRTAEMQEAEGVANARVAAAEAAEAKAVEAEAKATTAAAKAEKAAVKAEAAKAALAAEQVRVNAMLADAEAKVAAAEALSGRVADLMRERVATFAVAAEAVVANAVKTGETN